MVCSSGICDGIYAVLNGSAIFINDATSNQKRRYKNELGRKKQVLNSKCRIKDFKFLDLHASCHKCYLYYFKV